MISPRIGLKLHDKRIDCDASRIIHFRLKMYLQPEHFFPFMKLKLISFNFSIKIQFGFFPKVNNLISDISIFFNVTAVLFPKVELKVLKAEVL